MTPLTTERLVIRDWEERDRDLFFRIHSDPRVMHFFPWRRKRVEADAMFDALRAKIAAHNIGFAAIERIDTGQCIGFAGLHRDSVVPTMPRDSVEIGWRLAPEHWGKGFASEAALALLTDGFTVMALQEIISYAVWNNERSTAVMRRIGMREVEGGDFDHPRVPDSHRHLKRHVLYRIDRAAWLEGSAH